VFRAGRGFQQNHLLSPYADTLRLGGRMLPVSSVTLFSPEPAPPVAFIHGTYDPATWPVKLPRAAFQRKPSAFRLTVAEAPG
jgi:hypothetical protein